MTVTSKYSISSSHSGLTEQSIDQLLDHSNYAHHGLILIATNISLLIGERSIHYQKWGPHH